MKKSIKSRLGEKIPIRHFYLHIPFCQKKCAYCSFHSVNFNSDILGKYLSALQKEIDFMKKRFEFQPKTIYFGGGTPSLLSANEINRILDNFDLSQIEEITLEANPITITRKYAKELSQTKINRISMGVQSWIDEELRLLGRIHSTEIAEKAYNVLRQVGFENISLDLIYGLPQQKLTDLKYSIQKMIDLKPEHISTYCLSLEEDVPLYQKKNLIPPDEKVSEFYFEIRKQLLSAGYNHYELSNFALEGCEAKHNSAYWEDAYYLGLGAAAAGYVSAFRYQNNLLHTYMQDMESENLFCNREEIGRDEKKHEYIFLHLRTSKGIDLEEFKNKFSADFIKSYEGIISKYRNNFIITETHFALKAESYFISNTILSEFM